MPLRASTAFSAGVHVVLTLLVGLYWVVPAVEEEVVIRVVSRCPPAKQSPPEIERRADDHPPIVPKVFQPDSEIVNDAEEVVVNSWPTNIDAASHAGDSLDFVSDSPFRGKLINARLGLAGGASGLYGNRAANFG